MYTAKIQPVTFPLKGMNLNYTKKENNCIIKFSQSYDQSPVLLPFIKYIEKDAITELLNSVSTVFKTQISKNMKIMR